MFKAISSQVKCQKIPAAKKQKIFNEVTSAIHRQACLSLIHSLIQDKKIIKIKGKMSVFKFIMCDSYIL